MKIIVKKIWVWWIKFNYSYFTKFSTFLVFLVGFYYMCIVFQKLSEDTTAITNSAFAIMASLAALSFSCSRSIVKNEEDKDRFTYAGERFLHAGILLLISSILKYALISLKNIDVISSTGSFWNFIFVSVGVIVGVLFGFSILSAHGGLVVINKLLWKRINRFSEWDNFC